MPPTDSRFECMRCRRPLPSAATRCLHCGALPGRQCPACKGLSPAASVVCVFCGSRMPTDAPVFLAGLDPLPGQAPPNRSDCAPNPAGDPRRVPSDAPQPHLSEALGASRPKGIRRTVRMGALVFAALALGIVIGRSMREPPPKSEAPPSPARESVASLPPPPTPPDDSQGDAVERQNAVDAAARTDSAQALSGPGGDPSQGAQGAAQAESVPPLPNNAVKPASLKTPVNYATDKASVQTIVQALCAQAGLTYDWGKSYANTNPTCRAFVWNVSIVGDPCDRALDSILSPKGLAYAIENDKLVLIRK